MSAFNKTVVGTRLVIAPVGVIDANNAASFQDDVNESLADVSEVIFDFSRLEYISSAGLRVLLATSKAMGKPGAVHVRGAAEDVLQVLTVTRLAQFMTIE